MLLLAVFYSVIFFFKRKFYIHFNFEVSFYQPYVSNKCTIGCWFSSFHVFLQLSSKNIFAFFIQVAASLILVIAWSFSKCKGKICILKLNIWHYCVFSSGETRLLIEFQDKNPFFFGKENCNFSVQLLNILAY